MQESSKRSLIASARISALSILLAVSLQGCSTLSEVVAKAKEAERQAAAPKVVAVPVPAASLPDAPAELQKCLLSKPDANKTTADASVKVLLGSDATKRECAKKLFAWYRQRQLATAPSPDGHPKTAPAAKKPAATWE